MLEVRKLAVSYGHIEALKDISLKVSIGEFIGVIGANGAGKSSLLLALSGAIPVTAGKVIFEGEDITRLPQHMRVQQGIAIVPEGRQLFGPLTVLENLELGAFHRRNAPRAQVRADLELVLELFPALRSRVAQLAATLSGGEQQMVSIGRALMSRPRLMLLDEPSFGLAPLVFQGILATLERLNADGLTCLMVEQDAALALETTTRSYLFRTGLVVAEGSSEELRKSAIVEDVYLGGEGK